MKLFFAAFIGIVVSAYASPVTRSNEKYGAASNATVLEKRTVGGVELCTDTDWRGNCNFDVYTLDKCIETGGAYYQTISSFGPDKCTKCTAWMDDHCTVQVYPTGEPHPTWTFQYPGDDTGGLGTEIPWNDLIRSFKCEASC